jgi:hypothetical protein
MADHVRGDFLSKRGAQVITDSLTYTGTGGVDGCSLGDNVDGQKILIPFKEAITAGDTGNDLGDAGLCGSATCTKWAAPKAGSVVGLSIYAPTAVATGHITATVYVGSTSTGFSVTLNTTVTHSAVATQAKDTDTFAAGKLLSVKIMLGNTASTANSIGGAFIVEI